MAVMHPYGKLDRVSETCGLIAKLCASSFDEVEMYFQARREMKTDE